MDAYLKTNQSLWNNWTRLHERSTFYDIENFKAGRSSLNPLEIEEVGDVAGKSLLHLQCHFGMDTLSWARRGAEVTGVDFADEAIRLAESLSEETNIKARFIRSNIYELQPDVLSDEFDVVFTSYGVLGWLPDLQRWAQIVARYLKSGGVFYIVEFHPFLFMLDEQGDKFEYSYFHSAEPLEIEEHGSYAARAADFQHTSYAWIHSLSDVINAIIKANLQIEFVREFPFSPYNCWSFLEERAPGEYTTKDHPGWLPLTFSLRARRPANEA